MKKYLLTFVLLSFTLGIPVAAMASEHACENDTKEVSWYNGKAAAAWSSYGACKAIYWTKGERRKHCNPIKHRARHYSDEARKWDQRAKKDCIDD